MDTNNHPDIPEIYAPAVADGHLDIAKADSNHAIILTTDAPAMASALESAGRRVYAEGAFGRMYMPKDYDPAAHAQRLIVDGDTHNAELILRFVPDTWASTPDRRARVAIALLLCIFNWHFPDDDSAALFRLANAQDQFYAAVQNASSTIAPYHIMAQLWADMGNMSMAKKLLMIVEEINPHPSTQEMIERCPATAADGDSDAIALAAYEPRILFLTTPHMDHGLDCLYDGLCRVIGEDRVDVVPDKPTLRGDASGAWRYPCIFEGHHQSPTCDEALAHLGNGHYDLIILALQNTTWGDADAQTIISQSSETPIAIVDQRDDPIDYTLHLHKFWGVHEHCAYFKREMLPGGVYDERVHPLPMSYSAAYTPSAIDGDRDTPLFWAGNRDLAMRALFLDTIEKKFGWDLNREYAPDEYREALLRSRIVLSLFGGGYDTVRYWEAAAHGAMLLAERPPIHIPHNFVDGESAVFFDTPGEAIEKLEYYLAHPDKASAIAARGHAHFLEHHTSEARARQFLSRIFPLAKKTGAE